MCTFPPNEVARVYVRSVVYNVTKFIDEVGVFRSTSSILTYADHVGCRQHPGGDEVILAEAGESYDFMFGSLGGSQVVPP